ncbi:SRPBCC family protein [Sphingobium nicotianae]|uniref:SRPBCC domain-containing protein n=1 Tax=Sphingobium nicotianae TaxID=2782607 RepID=A0A9X1DB81_9SPHN|nr:SRPBCC domain-containing protein [Sphingobium nicotianae]MBT2186726.1 SRPBCC domain-containing protein [Sphingobium nicotianae]
MRWTMMAALMIAAPARADVVEASDSGFTVSNARIVAASPDAVWAAIVTPSRWWSAAHSWSGSAANFSIDPVAGGCFCERWAAGSVEHARVIYAVRGKQLRLNGALGPLQGEAVTGTMSFTLTPEGKGTRIVMDYVVGGHARFVLKELAPAVDGVMKEQIMGLARLFGG